MKPMTSLFHIVPVCRVEFMISFLFQAELSLDRCENLAELRSYYLRIWGQGVLDDLLKEWSGYVEGRNSQAGDLFGLFCVPAVIQWLLFKRVALSREKIEKTIECLRSFWAVIQGIGDEPEKALISLRMRLYSAAISLGNWLPKSRVDKLRSIEHLNAAPHLLLRPFDMRCG